MPQPFVRIAVDQALRQLHRRRVERLTEPPPPEAPRLSPPPVPPTDREMFYVGLDCGGLFVGKHITGARNLVRYLVDTLPTERVVKLYSVWDPEHGWER